jgi:hypothetical protein
MKASKVVFIYEYNHKEGSHLGQQWHSEPSKEVKSHKYISAAYLKEWARKKNMELESEGEGDYCLGYISAMIDLIDEL